MKVTYKAIGCWEFLRASITLSATTIHCKSIARYCRTYLNKVTHERNEVWKKFYTHEDTFKNSLQRRRRHIQLVN